MTPVFLDFESFWSKTHSVKAMGPMAYVTHPDTEIISCAIKIDTASTEVVFGEQEVGRRLHEIDWSSAWALAHNMSGFDALILAWRFGITPRMWGCTMAMARPLHAKTTGLSLGALVKHYGIGVKDNSALIATQGKHLCDFTPEEIKAMKLYNAADTDQLAALFHCLLPHYNAHELWHIHTKIHSFVASPLELDVPLLETALVKERQDKQKVMLHLADKLGIDCTDREAAAEHVRGQLASASKFANLLTALGVPVPMKPSPKHPEKLIPALAKTDEAFVALQEDPNELVAAATRARLSAKSTLTETRIEAFLDAAQFSRGRWPVTSHYCGADTTGRGSGWHYNPYNLPKLSKRARNSDALRRSIRAPKGFAVVAADLSGIELRFNHFLWRVPYSTSLWRQKPDADIYRAYYANKLGVRPEDITTEQRFAAKVESLGLGFGMGYLKYQDTARVQSEGQIVLTLDEADIAVQRWRELHPEIVAGWRTCHEALNYIVAGKEIAIDPHGLFTTCAEGIRLQASGRLIRYPNLRKEVRLEHPTLPDGTVDTSREPRPRTDWFYGDVRHKARIYAGKIDENIVQAGARDVMYEALFDVYKQTGLPHAHEVYDEGIWVVPERDAEDFLTVVQERLRTPPKWWPQLVTWSEGSFGETYADCK